MICAAPESCETAIRRALGAADGADGHGRRKSGTGRADAEWTRSAMSDRVGKT